MRLKKFLVGLATASLVSLGMGVGLVTPASAAPTDPHPARVGVAGTGCYKTNAERGKVGVEWVAFNDFPSSTMTITASSNTDAFPVGTTVSGNAAKVSNVVNYVPGTYRLTLSFTWEDGATKGPTTGSVTVTKAQLTGDCDPIQYLADPTYTIEPATCTSGEVLRFGTVPDGAIWSPNSLQWDGVEGPRTRIAISAETTSKDILFTSSKNRYWSKLGIILADRLPKQDCTTAVDAPDITVIDQQCTPGDGGKAVFTDGTITVPENEGYTVDISLNEAGARADNARAVSTFSVGAPGEYTVRLIENTGYNLQAGNGFDKDGNDLVQTVTVKGADDCTVPPVVEEPVVEEPVVQPEVPVVGPVTDMLASGGTEALKPSTEVVFGSTHKAAPRLAQTGPNDLAWMAGAGFIALFVGAGAVVAARPKRSRI